MTRVVVGLRVVVAIPFSPSSPYTPQLEGKGEAGPRPDHDPNLVFWAFPHKTGSWSARPAVNVDPLPGRGRVVVGRGCARLFVRGGSWSSLLGRGPAVSEIFGV